MSWYWEEGPESDVVLSSRIRLARNHSRYAFPNRLRPEQARVCYEEIAQTLFSANSRMKEEFNDLFLADLPEVTVRELIEKRLLSEEWLARPESARALVRKDEKVSILLGEEDHIRIQAMEAGLNLEAAYLEAEQIAQLLESGLPLAYDQKYGFLTSCPTNVGTGMRASVLVHLPALGRTQDLAGDIEALRKAGFAVRGSYGEHSRATGYLYQISNQFTLGVSERESLDELEQVVRELVDKERKVRAYLWKKKRLTLEDRLCRSYGILSQARLLTREEAQVRLSDLRLGVALKLFPGLTAGELNRLDIESGPAAIQRKAGEVLQPEQRDSYRATFFRERLASDTNGARGAEETDEGKKG